MVKGNLIAVSAGTPHLRSCPCTFPQWLGRRSVTGESRRVFLVIISVAIAWCLVVVFFSDAYCSPKTMRGPAAKRHRQAVADEIETSPLRIVLLGAVSVFQKYISPVDGDRCGFVPSCSAFARMAVERHGSVLGITLTADRLMRCTVFTRPGADYVLLPNGKLFDPVENNLLSDP